MIALLSDLWPYLIAAGAALLGVFGVYRAGRRAERDDRARQDMADHIETRRRMDDAQADTPDSVAGAREWLRDRAKRRDGDL